MVHVVVRVSTEHHVLKRRHRHDRHFYITPSPRAKHHHARPRVIFAVHSHGMARLWPSVLVQNEPNHFPIRSVGISPIQAAAV